LVDQGLPEEISSSCLRATPMDEPACERRHPMTAPRDDSPANLKLLADVAAAGPEVLRRDLLEAGVGRHSVRIDGSAVAKIDFGSWQILCAAFRDADQAGVPLAFAAASLHLRSSAARLGIAALLGTDRLEPVGEDAR
jgi:hypothetical protein